jgi:Na+-transporting NADH:ubiquinone oxidoreductase subunit D
MPAGQAKRVFLDSIGRGNPVFAQILGICSTLAVTNVLKNTVVMCVGLVLTVAVSNTLVSLLRRAIPSRVRMMAEVMIIASVVIVFDIGVRAYLPDVSRQLGPYVGLIITNCIVMGRAEAFALQNPPLISFVDGIASGVGYSYVLLVIAFVRELLGSGAVWGHHLMPGWWVNWSIMVTAPGAFFVLAVFIWIVKGYLVGPDTGGADGTPAKGGGR